MIQRNPTTKANSTRKLAKKLDISNKAAWDILHEDLGLKPYKFLKRQKLTEPAKKKRTFPSLFQKTASKAHLFCGYVGQDRG
jgi:hypothetical protein